MVLVTIVKSSLMKIEDGMYPRYLMERFFWPTPRIGNLRQERIKTINKNLSEIIFRATVQAATVVNRVWNLVQVGNKWGRKIRRLY